MMAPVLKFLHCMKEASYLFQALEEGLMIRDHPVEYEVTKDPNEISSLIQSIKPFLETKLNQLGTTFSRANLTGFFRGIGFQHGDVPMLCFTEVPYGKSLENNRNKFGNYGLVIKPTWLEAYNAVRVQYIGNNSPESRVSFINLAKLHISGLHYENGNLVVNINTVREGLVRFTRSETEDHSDEEEWRIIGETGYMGGMRETEKRLKVRFEDIEFVFVPAEEVQQVEEFIIKLASKTGTTAHPSVIQFPRVIPGWG